jgi:deazaflavin-dependent oxidoreductase (nitroreductase family)
MPEKRFSVLRKFNRAILNPITRSLTAGRVSFCSLVYHVGRRSGKEYATPVMAVLRDGFIYIPLTYGPDTDWYLNIQAAGLCRVKIEGKIYSTNHPELVDAAAASVAFPDNFLARIKVNQFLRLTLEPS